MAVEDLEGILADQSCLAVLEVVSVVVTFWILSRRPIPSYV